jgi:hypothetical protein
MMSVLRRDHLSPGKKHKLGEQMLVCLLCCSTLAMDAVIELLPLCSYAFKMFASILWFAQTP